MREIKFRAYSKSAGRMAIDVHLEYDTITDVHWEGGEPEDFYGLESFAGYLDDENWVVEQFTGLLDKNGVEIYEGDLISSARFHSPQEVTWKNTVETQRGHGESYFSACARFFGGYEREIPPDLEVIGNIHEASQ